MVGVKLTVGVMGASGGDLSEPVRRKAYELGEAVAAHDAVLITGGCPGLPYEAVRGARAKGSSSASRPGFQWTSTAASMARPWTASTC